MIVCMVHPMHVESTRMALKPPLFATYSQVFLSVDTNRHMQLKTGARAFEVATCMWN